MRFDHATDEFIADWRAEGRINSDHTERAYRECLEILGREVGNRDPGKIGKADIKRTLARWPGANTRRQKYSIMRSFFQWCVWEGHARTNPVDDVRPTKAREPRSTRLTAAEAVRFMQAADPILRDRWVARIMLGGGLRNTEMRALRGRAFLREGFVILDEGTKREKHRVVPVTVEMAPVVDEILALVAPEDYVLPGRQVGNPGINDRMVDRPQKMLSSPSLIKQVARIAERAKIGVHVTPHTLRHTYGEHSARWAGLRATQGLLGHESVATTADTYTGGASAEEMRTAMSGFSYANPLLSTPEEAKTPDGRTRFT